MQQIGARTFRTVLIATALTTALAVPAFATPATDTPSQVTKQAPSPAKKAKKAKRMGDFDFSYDLKRGNSPNTARGFGQFDWTEQAVQLERSKLIDTGKGVSLLIVKLTRKNNRVSTERFSADNETVNTDFQLSRNVVQIEVQVCKVRTETRCSNKVRLR
jgi:hypothetical protein